MTSYPLYDYLLTMDVAENNDLPQIFNFSLLNMSAEQANMHRREILALIMHHANLLGDKYLFQANLITNDLNSQIQNIKFLVSDLPVELRKLLAAYIKYYTC
jgi:hypothetical protein